MCTTMVELFLKSFVEIAQNYFKNFSIFSSFSGISEKMGNFSFSMYWNFLAFCPLLFRFSRTILNILKLIINWQIKKSGKFYEKLRNNFTRAYFNFISHLCIKFYVAVQVLYKMQYEYIKFPIYYRWTLNQRKSSFRELVRYNKNDSIGKNRTNKFLHRRESSELPNPYQKSSGKILFFKSLLLVWRRILFHWCIYWCILFYEDVFYFIRENVFSTILES